MERRRLRGQPVMNARKRNMEALRSDVERRRRLMRVDTEDKAEAEDIVLAKDGSAANSAANSAATSAKKRFLQDDDMWMYYFHPMSEWHAQNPDAYWEHVYNWQSDVDYAFLEDDEVEVLADMPSEYSAETLMKTLLALKSTIPDVCLVRRRILLKDDDVLGKEAGKKHFSHGFGTRQTVGWHTAIKRRRPSEAHRRKLSSLLNDRNLSEEDRRVLQAEPECSPEDAAGVQMVMEMIEGFIFGSEAEKEEGVAMLQMLVGENAKKRRVWPCCRCW
jgi:hypothetical protein